MLMILILLGGSVHTLKEKAEALIVASKVTGLEVNADKTKYMVMSRNQNQDEVNKERFIVIPLKGW
jgi:hypothetical protein